VGADVEGQQGCPDSILDSVNDNNVTLLDFLTYLTNIVFINGFLQLVLGFFFMILG
jgi:hypothetical protein